VRTGTKLGAYGAGLVIVLGGGAGLGAAAGPIDVAGDDHQVPPATTPATTPAEPAPPAGEDRLDLEVTIPGPSTTSTVDGYEVTMAGDPVPGESELAFTVRLDGEVVTPDPYLDADGHLVALRVADLAYQHVHPLDTPGAEVRFGADLPTLGAYRLFLDFSHGGEVHTAAFTVEVPEHPSAPADDHADQEGH
jgi:hypothetical protein